MRDALADGLVSLQMPLTSFCKRGGDEGKHTHSRPLAPSDGQKLSKADLSKQNLIAHSKKRKLPLLCCLLHSFSPSYLASEKGNSMQTLQFTHSQSTDRFYFFMQNLIEQTRMEINKDDAEAGTILMALANNSNRGRSLTLPSLRTTTDYTPPVDLRREVKDTVTKTRRGGITYRLYSGCCC